MVIKYNIVVNNIIDDVDGINGVETSDI